MRLDLSCVASVGAYAGNIPMAPEFLKSQASGKGDIVYQDSNIGSNLPKGIKLQVSSTRLTISLQKVGNSVQRLPIFARRGPQSSKLVSELLDIRPLYRSVFSFHFLKRLQEFALHGLNGPLGRLIAKAVYRAQSITASHLKQFIPEVLDESDVCRVRRLIRGKGPTNSAIKNQPLSVCQLPCFIMCHVQRHSSG